MYTACFVRSARQVVLESARKAIGPNVLLLGPGSPRGGGAAGVSDLRAADYGAVALFCCRVHADRRVTGASIVLLSVRPVAIQGNRLPHVVDGVRHIGQGCRHAGHTQQRQQGA